MSGAFGPIVIHGPSEGTNYDIDVGKSGMQSSALNEIADRDPRTRHG